MTGLTFCCGDTDGDGNASTPAPVGDGYDGVGISEFRTEADCTRPMCVLDIRIRCMRCDARHDDTPASIQTETGVSCEMRYAQRYRRSAVVASCAKPRFQLGSSETNVDHASALSASISHA